MANAATVFSENIYLFHKNSHAIKLTGALTFTFRYLRFDLQPKHLLPQRDYKSHSMAWLKI